MLIIVGVGLNSVHFLRIWALLISHLNNNTIPTQLNIFAYITKLHLNYMPSSMSGSDGPANSRLALQTKRTIKETSNTAQ